MTFHRYLAGAAAVLAAAALAACSSSSGGSPAGPATQPPSSAAAVTSSDVAAGTSPAAGTSTAAATGTAVDVCTALPAATVAQLTGVHVTKAHARPPLGQSGTTIATCEYSGGLNQLDITLARSSLAAQLFDDDYSANKQVIKTTAMVSGIGDKAFTADFPSMWLEVLWGDEQLKVDGASAVSLAAAKRVLTALHAKA